MLSILNSIIKTITVDLWGHQLFPGGFFVNILLASSGLTLVWNYNYAKNRNNIMIKVLFGWFYLVFLPNSIYLAFEIKHLLLKDNIADEMTNVQVGVFTGLCILGLFLAIVTILETVRYVRPFKEHPYITIVMLSFVSSLGATVGFYDLTSLIGLIAPGLIFKYTVRVFSSSPMVMLMTATVVLLTSLCMVSYTVFYKKKA